MQQGKKARDIRDISHLYLSGKERKGEGAARAAALLLLASPGGSPLRAWLAAGLAEAFAAHNAAVTLIESWVSLPNTGYYFALESSRYLMPVLEPEAVIEIEAGSRLRVFSARAPAVPGPEPGPGVTIAAFDWPFEEGLQAVAGDSPAMLLTVSEEGSSALDTLIREFAGVYPGAPVMSLYPGEKREGPEGVEQCPFPRGMLAELSRRKPPESQFLGGLAGEILQRLGSRRKGVKDERTG
jgi:hypothetical protein